MDYFLCNCLLGGLRWEDFKNLNFEEIDLMQQHVRVFSRKGKKELNFTIFASTSFVKPARQDHSHEAESIP